MSNYSTLSWEEPENGKKPAGYYLLMRETYQPLWEKKIYVEGTEITVPYSKDNYFFAVQAVDKEGHESLPVFPESRLGGADSFYIGNCFWYWFTEKLMAIFGNKKIVFNPDPSKVAVLTHLIKIDKSVYGVLLIPFIN